MTIAASIPTTTWHGCYDDRWHGIVHPRAFSHPAKFSRGLICRIIQHGFERGYWKRGDLIGDCFGGVGLGGLIAAPNGLRWVGVELEWPFVHIARANFIFYRRRWGGLIPDGCMPRIIQGDSRRFAEIIGADAIVTSPPFAETLSHGGGPQTRPDLIRGGKSLLAIKDGYGAADGQIGALATGDLDAIVTSPVYAEGATHPSLGHPELVNGGKGDYLKLATTGTTRGSEKYGSVDGQIGALRSGDLDAVITSSPFLAARSNTTANSGGIQQAGYNGRGVKEDVGARTFLGGASEDRSAGNIEALPPGELDAVVTSPPYADSVNSDRSGIDYSKTTPDYPGRINHAERNAYLESKLSELHYGASTGQIGAQSGDTYWSAMRDVYAQCWLALRPGGIAIIVIKDFVKDRKRVPLCDQTLRLLVHVGFEPVERIHAMLVRERRHAGLWHEHVERKSRKSFFRRLAEKNGSPAIDHEEVLVVRRPT